MKIYDSLIDLILSRCKVEYNGTHNSDPKSPLWGRRAYWRVSIPGYGFCCKITAPVKSINPKQKTLDRLLRAELRRRIEEIQEICETNHYGEVSIYMRDPYGVRPLVNAISGAYTYYDDSDQELKIKFFSSSSNAYDKTVVKKHVS